MGYRESHGTGGLQEKTLLPVLADGPLRFQGTVTLPDGRTFLDRTTLTPLEGDRRPPVSLRRDRRPCVHLT